MSSIVTQELLDDIIRLYSILNAKDFDRIDGKSNNFTIYIFKYQDYCDIRLYYLKSYFVTYRVYKAKDINLLKKYEI